MNFADKLNFLFEITGAEGKELAAALYITPPQISKMRKGLRGLPRNKESVRSIALFFAQRCTSIEQRDALAKGMRIAQVRSINNVNHLSEMLFSWFLNEKFPDSSSEKDADAFLHRLNFSSDAKIPVKSDTTQPLHSTGSNITAYYGIEGKQVAHMLFLQNILEKKKAFDICTLSDEDNTWIDDDPSYANKYYEHLIRLTDEGCFFKRIVEPFNNIAQAFSSLNRWYPLYLAGKATSFYYKRMRDDLNRITILVVQDVAALFSFSVGGIAGNDCVTFYTTDTNTVNSMFLLFKKYLSLCDPAMKTYNANTSEAQIHERLLEYETYAATCMQLSNSLSFITLPWEIAVSLRTDKGTQAKDVFLTSFAKRYSVFKKNLEHYDFFDFIRLADVDDVMDGMVSIPAANILGDEMQYYSPGGYLQHLKSIEHLFKRYSRYHVIIEPPTAKNEPIIYVKENYAVLITRASIPFVIFDASEPNLINAFTENIRRRIPENALDAKHREKTLTAIQTLIEQIEERMASAYN